VTSARWTCSKRSLISQFEQYVKLNKKVPPEILTSLAGIDSPAAWPTPSRPTCRSSSTEKQKVLEILDVRERLEHVMR
jgi:ATP-dependent Lon protease